MTFLCLYLWQRKGLHQSLVARICVHYVLLYLLEEQLVNWLMLQGGALRRLSFVDLAGSERARRTGNHGARLKCAVAIPLWHSEAEHPVATTILRKTHVESIRSTSATCILNICSRESVAINASLMTLGRCLEALRWNQQHPAAEQRLVPYREARVSCFFLSPSDHSFPPDTRSVFASRTETGQQLGRPLCSSSVTRASVLDTQSQITPARTRTLDAWRQCCLQQAISRLLSLSVLVPQVTHLFRDVLHGWGRVLLSVNVSPCACDYDETSHVLKVWQRTYSETKAAWQQTATAKAAKSTGCECIRV